jgi:hypothetical protein
MQPQNDKFANICFAVQQIFEEYFFKYFFVKLHFASKLACLSKAGMNF